jgi:esterase/lipase superfamily enzyme
VPRVATPPQVSGEAGPPPKLPSEATSAAASPAPSATAGVQVKQPLVKVYFATDRLPSGAPGPPKYFGAEWNKNGDHLFTGYVTVSIPPPHKEGKVERPFKFWIIEFSEDPKKHVVLTELKPVQGNDFYETLRNEYARRPPEKRSAFVFIHGFNVTFDDAAYRTAQLAYDLDFDGVPMMYSWPSQGRLLAYNGDSETVDWSSPHLQSFLERVARESGALRIHLVAHSMGNQLLANALMALGRQADIQPLFDNVIMAAPDVNAYTFTDQIWPGIKKAAKRFTVYASSDDEALKASKSSKGPNDFDRLGEAGPKIVVISGLDTVDASGIDTSLLGHSYVDSCIPVMDDVQMILQKGLAPLQRKLHDRYKEGLAYWTFR